MHHEPIDRFVPHPASKWTDEVQARFLEHLSQKGNVRAACLLVGASTETAYRLRRRDRTFARGWGAAMVHARRAAEHVLADRAIDGVVEDIYYRGERVGSKRKYDARLLLAHLGRLDRQATPEAEAEADRFDEILAVILNEPVPSAFASRDEILGIDRQRFAERAAIAAGEDEQFRHEQTVGDESEDLSPEQSSERQEAIESARADAEEDARAEARWQWDSWHSAVCEAVDAALAGEAAVQEDCAADAAPRGDGGERPEGDFGRDADISLRTVSTVSTPALAGPDAQTGGAARADGPSGEPTDDPPQ